VVAAADDSVIEPGPAGAAHPEEPALVRKLRARRETHKEHGRIYRGAFVLAGLTLLLGGIAMLVLPGPAFVVIPIGLAILSLEFVWAERMLDTALEKADAAKHKAAEASRTQKILSGAATAAGIAAAVAAALLWDIPYLPV
jgi:uncharacterized protein (TIGR02611 family)